MLERQVDLTYLITKLITFWFKFLDLILGEPYNNTNI